jgi:succinyl-CoA:acetate CoA-transferase
MHTDRIRLKSLLDKVVSAEEAARFIRNGMTIGMSGFTRAGEAKAVPLALAERAAHEELKITLMTGASLGNDLAGVLARRLPFQPDPALRRAINAGHLIEFLSHEVKRGRLSLQLQPLQAGIGTIANGVLHGLIESPFHGLKMYHSIGDQVRRSCARHR